MGKETMLVALGGNAILRADDKGTAEEQFRNIETICEQLLELIKRGYELVITHGNGPQVGNLAIQQEVARRSVPPQPLDVLSAMTQGQIGYMIQQTLANDLKRAGISKPVVTVITQVLVDEDDVAFRSPQKPIGPFYDWREAREVIDRDGYLIEKVKPTGKRAYRRVVPSPDPIRIVESDAIRRLVESGFVVIASGGGGIPVVTGDDGGLKGVEGVIDKDLAGEKLAEAIGADIFLVITDVEKVKLNFGKPNEKDIDRMTVDEAERYLAEGHFLPGSMGPKVLACIRFIRWGGRKAVITSLDKSLDAIEGRAGTLVCR